MTFESIKEYLMYGGGGVAFILTMLQIAPININPWSWIAKRIGRAINGELIDKVDGLAVDMKKNKDDDDEQWASLSRSHILRFGDELRHGVAHSQEHFDQILEDISKYEQYCDGHPTYKNGKAKASIKLIKNTYQKCLEENNFL
jgi:hypothetical protein